MNSLKDLGSEYLIVDYGKTHKNSLNMTYDKYRTRFNKVITWLNLNPAHKPHDPRMTFITRCKKAGTDEFAFKRNGRAYNRRYNRVGIHGSRPRLASVPTLKKCIKQPVTHTLFIHFDRSILEKPYFPVSIEEAAKAGKF